MSLFDAVVTQAISRRFHRHVDDVMLDRCAAECGCAPIGRLCLLDDDAVASIVKRCRIENGTRIFDLGCGRGFFGRWLHENGTAAEYAGVDRDANAVAAAQRQVPTGSIMQGDFRIGCAQPSYDVVTAMEVTIGGAVDSALLSAAASALVPEGRLALTVASLDGAHADRLACAEAEARSRFTVVYIENWTQIAEPFTRHTFDWWLNATWPPEVQEKSALEARAVLAAIARNEFHYAVLFAQR